MWHHIISEGLIVSYLKIFLVDPIYLIKHREKIRSTGKTRGILSRLECGHPDNRFQIRPLKSASSEKSDAGQDWTEKYLLDDKLGNMSCI